VKVDPDQRRGSVFVPLHWSDQFASSARIDAIIAANTDPISGQPEFKYTPVSVTPLAAIWHGFAVVGERPRGLRSDYWAMAPIAEGWRLEFAGLNACNADELLRALLPACLDEAHPDLISYMDPRAGENRIAAFKDDALIGALYISSKPLSVARTWIAEQLGRPLLDGSLRGDLLAGRSAKPAQDRGPTVCVCFDVGYNEIVDAVANKGCRTVADVGLTLKAGTNCGSCRGEIARIVATVDARLSG
jgi:assimilatory nitrate reductase catalytic subunit